LHHRIPKFVQTLTALQGVFLAKILIVWSLKGQILDFALNPR